VNLDLKFLSIQADAIALCMGLSGIRYSCQVAEMVPFFRKYSVISFDV
jgi:hypothetical protein